MDIIQGWIKRGVGMFEADSYEILTEGIFRRLHPGTGPSLEHRGINDSEEIGVECSYEGVGVESLLSAGYSFVVEGEIGVVDGVQAASGDISIDLAFAKWSRGIPWARSQGIRAVCCLSRSSHCTAGGQREQPGEIAEPKQVHDCSITLFSVKDSPSIR